MTAPAGAAENAPTPKDLAGPQEKANQAAARLAAGQSALAKVEDDVAALNGRVSATRSRLEQLRGEVRQLGVRQYVQGGDPSVWIVQTDLSQAARGRALLRYVTVGRTDAMDEYRAASDDLAESQSALERRLAQQRKAVEGLRAEEARVAAELDRLSAAQQAFEAKVAREKAAAERAAAQAAAAVARPAAPGPGRPPAPSRAVLRPPSGGPVVIGSGQWVCPVQGPRAFTNDWGQPRSGGRRHQGTDILSPRGTPIVANVSGTVSPHNSGLGGISYYLRGDDGNTYFGTHLDRLSGASGRVSAGTVIGYNGNSGNARGGPTHLHFEIHPGGGGPVNPYPTVARYC
ncbi:MAG: peptidoglycan DD-metalloendopeptidase family protein [Actinomycetota bacterium]|nr:peptidoglycan DD-metalloendopeptidase family protein [Actinomycetota bacterium]